MGDIPSYYNWLKDQVVYFTERGTYDMLMRRMYEREYYAIIMNDGNRAADGIHMRRLYDNVYDTHEEETNNSPCSFLEFLAALAQRMSFIVSPAGDDNTRNCFWILMTNLGLEDMVDVDYLERGGDMLVDEMIDRINERMYGADGVGGLFPLRYTEENQRNVEVWYQLNYYIREHRQYGIPYNLRGQDVIFEGGC